MGKITREKFKTYGNVFDNFTLRNLFSLETKGYFDTLKSPVSTGKEANIFSAVTKDGNLVIIKIYRLENCEFKKMYDYIKQDSRYPSIKPNVRQVIFAWAQREFRNLLKAREIGVRVPMPIFSFHNILVLEHIGDEVAAPQLKNYVVQGEGEDLYKKILKQMRKLWQGGLVHGDLSGFNILVHNNKSVFIDFSQSTTTKATNARELLDRDIKNICTFFKKKGVNCSEIEMLEFILKE